MFERLFVGGIVLGVGGIILGVMATRAWGLAGFGPLGASESLRPVIWSITLLILGGQTALAGCFLGIINMLADRRLVRAREVVAQAPETVATAANYSGGPLAKPNPS